jgi:transposase
MVQSGAPQGEESLRLRLLLTHRRTLKRKLLDIENEVRQAVKAFGIRLGSGFGHAAFGKRVRAALTGDDLLLGITECMLRAWAVLWEEYNRLHKLLVRVTLQDELCRRFMAIPGVGPVTALAFKTGVDEPRRFRRSRTVSAHFGLTPRRIQSGDSVDFDGHISCIGEEDVRAALYEAAHVLLTKGRTHSGLKSWGLRVAKRRGHKRAAVAVARKLAMIMHRMWLDGSEFRFGKAPAADDIGGIASGALAAA